VLLRDGRVTALPALSQFVQIWQDDVPEQRVHGRHGEQPVKDRLRPRLVELVERVGEIVGDHRRMQRGRARWFADDGLRREGRRLGGGQSFGEVLSHETDTLDVRGRVEAKTACRARGANEAVAALPRPQQLGADAGALTQLADPEGSVAGHPKIIQQLDSFLTELRPTATVRT